MDDMMTKIENMICDYCADKYPFEYADHAIRVMTDTYECCNDCDDFSVADICESALEALCDGEYLSTLNLDELTVNTVYEIIEQIKGRCEMVVGYCVDIVSDDKESLYPYEMNIYKLFSDGSNENEHSYQMSTDDMQVVTGINDIEEIENTSDLDLARIIAENSQPYGLVGLPDCVCDYYSAGIALYDDIQPQCLNN